jgi:hypothetical protein
MELLRIRVYDKNNGRDRSPECRSHNATGSSHQAFSKPADFYIAKDSGQLRKKSGQ